MEKFAYKPAEWVFEIKDKDVMSSVYALLFDHQYTGKPFTEEGLKKEISEFEDLSEAQKQAVFQAIVEHKD